MNTATLSPALEAGLDTLRNAGLSGVPWREAPKLAEAALEKAGIERTDPVAYDVLIDAHEEGAQERARRAIQECIRKQRAIDEGVEFDASWDDVFIDVAAEAADLSPKDIVNIAREFCPIHDEEVAIFTAKLGVRKHHHAPADVAPEYRPEEYHREFLERHAKAIALGCTEFPDWHPEAIEESRKFFADRGETPPFLDEAASADVPAAPAFDLEREPGLLGDTARWSQVYAFRPVREFALPAAIAVGAAIFGRRLVTPSGLGLNLYQIAIAETGGGKDALLGAAKVLLAKAGLRHLLGPGDFSSDAALETSLRMHPSQLMPLDEFGKLMQAVNGRNSPVWAKLAAKALLEIHPRSQPGSEWSGKQKADPARDNASEPVHSPTLSILGVSTPEGFFEGMTQQTLEDGFLNRLMVFRAGAAGPRQRDAARLEPPADLIKRLQETYSASGPAGDLAEAKSRSATVEPTLRFARWADDDALRALEEVEAWEDAATDAGRRGVCGRAAEQTQKIATIRAAFREPADPAVTAEDIRWAFAMVNASIEVIEEGARSMMAGSEFEMLCNAIEAAVGRAGPMGLPYSYLLRAKGVSKHDDRMVESALKRLSQIRRIYVDIGPTTKAGRPAKRVRLMDFDEWIGEN